VSSEAGIPVLSPIGYKLKGFPPLGYLPHLPLGATRVRCTMLTQVHRRLGCVNATREDWQNQVREHIEHGTNFLLIISKSPAEVKKFCRLFGLPDDCSPRTLTQAEFFLLAHFIEPEAFDEILHLWSEEKQVVFVEQIDFPVNRPPRVKNYLVYSPVLGILAQHSHIRAARDDLENYEDSARHEGPNAEAAVYFFSRGKWRLFEGR